MSACGECCAPAESCAACIHSRTGPDVVQVLAWIERDKQEKAAIQRQDQARAANYAGKYMAKGQE